jgi:hypothetical protein
MNVICEGKIREVSMRKNKLRICFLVNILSLLITLSSVFAIDTKDWEYGASGNIHFLSKPEKEWLVQTAYNILKDAFQGKDKKYFEQFIIKENLLVVPIESGWHDLTEIKISFEHFSDGTGYMISYRLKKGSMTIIDVLGRYGTELAEIKTNEDLSKTITYVLKNGMGKLGHPLSPMFPNESLETVRKLRIPFAMLSFDSKDKVFVDTVVFTELQKN